MANPKYVTLVADTESVVTTDDNFGQIEVTIVANPALTYFNTKDAAIGPVAGSMDGNHALSSTLIAKVVRDETGGTASKVRIRSAGTPTVQVLGL